MTGQSETKHTRGVLSLGVWDDTLGYDCMTGGVKAGRFYLDGADYGQKPCQPIQPADKARLMADAARIVLTWNCHDELVAALRKLHHAVCGETGFASAVRAATGTAYPWPALDIAEEAAVAALAKATSPTP